ncbi:MAG: hypothetical protein ABSA05_00480 [Opitutaceae bacterium]|jgi:hypothetical protein
MHDDLISRLQPATRRHRWLVLSLQMAACWSLAAIAGFGFILVQRQTGWTSFWTLPVLAGLAGATCLSLCMRRASVPADYRAIAQKIERRHPELNGLLLTAVQQQPQEDGSPGYLRHRLVEQAIEHSRENDWSDIVPLSRFRLAQAANIAALGLLAVALLGLRDARRGEIAGAPLWGVVVTPGDASLERGESLVVLARFGGSLPAGVSLVYRSSGRPQQQLALVKSLADPVFGASIPEVDQDLSYHLEYSGRSTREFKVSVFERPRLERADATLTFPGYTHLAPKRIENTRRVSAVEGTRLDLALQLNKAVASAALVGTDAKKTVVPLQLVEGKAVASLPGFPLVASQTYDLRLVDRDGRTNPLSTPFVFNVLPDRPPEIHVTEPHGDIRPSPVEEVGFSGTVLGDFGVSAYGLAYSLAGGDAKSVELGRSVPAAQNRAFDTTLSLEDLGVQPGQLMSWYLWADDIGPDGKPRRTTSDLYFAEVRPFDEIFRESKAMQSQDGQQARNPEGNSQRLTDLQKQIISATWKLQRDPSEPKYTDDAKVVHDSQEQALTQAGSGLEKADDPRTKALWTAVAEDMKKAAGHLQEAGKAPEALAPALVDEQAAYQSLLRLQSRETEVARGRGGGRGRGGAGQRQLDQLDLTQEQNRYETQREAAPAETPEQHEQLQVMNRLQELARRQQDVNDRLKEMQTALQEARTDQEREDIRRQLKRLQDEQQQVLADVDELRQRMDRQENRSSMSDERQQLDQTRDDVQKAADAAGQGAVAQALDSGTRAQRQFQNMRDELHKQNSSQFSDDLREMRSQARELADQEEEVAKKLDPLGNGGQPKRLSDAAETNGPASEIDAQKKRMGDLVNRAKQVSQQAENSEPLLAEKLYDSLRKLSQDDAGTAKEFQQKLLSSGLLTDNLNDRLTDSTSAEGTKSLDLTSALLKEGYLPQAREAEGRARAGIDELKNGIERAADSVIGDDTEALRMARSELDAVTDELKSEAEAAPGRNPPGGQNTGGNPSAATAGEDRRQAGAASRGNPPPGDQQGQDGNPSVASADQNQQQAGAPSTGNRQPGDRRGQGGQAAGQNGRGAGNQARRLAGGDNGNASGQSGDPLDLANLIGGGGNRGMPLSGAPITGNGYGQWSDRLRDVEEIVDSPNLRNAVAAARESARLLRQDYTRDLKRPDWAVIQLQIVKPLTEVRDQISDELARRQSKDSLVPLDRDPVPNQYADSVRKYYEELGKDK